MTTSLEDLEITAVALVDNPANPHATVELFKRDYEKAGEPSKNKEAVVADAITKEEHDAVATKLAEAEATLAALDSMSNEDLAALRGFELAKKNDTEEIDKSALPEAVRKALEEADGLKARVAKMEQEQRIAKFTAEAAEYSHIGGAAELGVVLEGIDREAPEFAKQLVPYLKGAEARLATENLFSEFGASGDNQAQGDGTAEAMIEKHVEAGMARHEAISKVFTEHPELYPSV